jgi:hypothetical protein
MCLKKGFSYKTWIKRIYCHIYYNLSFLQMKICLNEKHMEQQPSAT